MSSNSTIGQLDLVTIEQWAERLKDLHLLDEEQQTALAQALHEAQIGRLDQPSEPLLTVLLFGPSGVGKSQLLNALAGEAIAESYHTRPTTSIPTIYAHQAVQVEQLFEYGTTLGGMTSSPASFRHHLREELRHVVIIDAPDIDSYYREHRAQVMQLLPAVDIVLYVVTPQTYKNDLGWQTVLKERGRRGFAFIMNKWDEAIRQVPKGVPGVDDDFLNLLRQKGEYARPLLFRVSAEYWVKRQENPALKISPPDGDQFPELQKWLSHGLSTSQVEKIQQRRRRVLFGHLAATVSTALPISLLDHPWATETTAMLAQLRVQGWQVIHPAIMARAQTLTDIYSIRTWPKSPGLFGLYLRGVTFVRSFLRSLAGLFTSTRQLNRWLGQQPKQEPAPMIDTELSTDQLVQLMEEWVTRIEFRARERKVPSQWVSKSWRAHSAAIPSRLADATDQAASKLLDRPVSRIRYAIGIAVITVWELLLTVFLVLVVWRLGKAFVLADYLGMLFVGNAIALLVSILLLGHVTLSCCFPSAEHLFRRRLESHLRSAWNDVVDDMERTVSDFLAETDQLHCQGQQIAQELNAEINRCSKIINTLSADADSTADQLFAPSRD